MDPSEHSLRTSAEGVEAIIRDAIDAHGRNTATITTEVADGVVTISIEPFNHEAASTAIRMTSEQAVLLTFGRTSVPFPSTDQGLEELKSALTLVFAGNFTEFGPGYGQSRFRLADGRQVWMGAKKSPLQRRFGPKRKYQPYN